MTRPLADGLPERNGDDGTPVRVTEVSALIDLDVCERLAWSPAAPEPTVDVAGASYDGEAEDTRQRTLALYADEAGAQRALGHLLDAFAACSSSWFGDTEQVHRVVASSADAATVTRRYRVAGGFTTGLEVLEAVRVGNALYLGLSSGEGGATADSVAGSLELVTESSADVVAALGVFVP